MPDPIKVCVVCGEKFELKPGKPGFANHCPSCSEDDSDVASGDKQTMDADARRNQKDMNDARRRAMRDLLYRKDS